MPADNTALLAKREKNRLAAEIKRRKKGKPQVKGTQICCVRCGELFVRNSHMAKACKPCRPIILRENSKQAQAELRASGNTWSRLNKDRSDEYHKNRRENNKELYASYTRAYRERNPDKILEYCLTRRPDVSRAYRENNKEYLKALNKNWREANKEILAEKGRIKNKKRYAENKEKEKARILRYRDSEQGKEVLAAARRRRENRKRRHEPMYALKVRMRCRVREAIRNRGYTKRSKTNEILGCGWDEFKAHIKRQFTKGMGWENLDKWHLDHIIPLDGAESIEEVYRLNHFTNIRPLWAEDNIRKSSKKIYLI